MLFNQLHQNCRLLVASIVLSQMLSQSRATDISDVISTLVEVERAAVGVGFDVETKDLLFDADKAAPAGEYHVRVLYDGVPYRRYHARVFKSLGPWPDNPNGSGVAETSSEHGFDGLLVQDLLISTGDPKEPVFVFEGKVKSGRGLDMSAFDYVTGWRFSIFGVRQPEGMLLSEYVSACVQESKRDTPGARAEIAAETGDVIELLLCRGGDGELVNLSLDKRRGLALKRVANSIKGILLDEAIVEELQELKPGIFFPKRTKVHAFYHNGEPRSRGEITLVAVSLIEKHSMTDERFRIDWPVGSSVRNEETGETIVIGPKPEDAKELVEASAEEMARRLPVDRTTASKAVKPEGAVSKSARAKSSGSEPRWTVRTISMVAAAVTTLGIGGFVLSKRLKRST